MALTEIDRELLQQCLSRQPSGWRDFVDRFAGLFVHVVNHTAQARSVVVTQADVDDLCAEVFMALLSNDMQVLKAFRAQSSLATYLTVVARRVVAREMAKRRMAEALGHVSAHQSALAAAGAPAAPVEFARVDNREAVEQMIAGLPENEATVVRQYHLEGKSYREISASLGIPENSIGPTLTRARARLRAAEVKP
jgi:RNA polymerase sigma-70 factor (ECF subfamily)